MKKIFVQYGAGNIGRGFVGAVFAQAGHAVRFIDVNPIVIDALQTRRQYTMELVSNEGSTFETIRSVTGVDGRDANAVTEAIAEADCMATAVGVHVLPRIAPMLAAGLQRRWASGRTDPFNIIICENLADADKLLRDYVAACLADDGERKRLAETVGFVEASIGRMVPVMRPEDSAADPLHIRVEPYGFLPVDADAVKGTLPDTDHLRLVTPFAFYMRRKLNLHNMSHALTAYIGQLAGYTFVWQAAGDPVIKLLAQRAMLENALALAKAFDMPIDGLLDHCADLLLRYENRALGDTVVRVGADTFRKTNADDRLAGAVALCRAQGVEPVYTLAGLATALYFKNDENDKGTARLQTMLTNDGTEAVLKNHCGLTDNEIELCMTYAPIIREQQGAAGLLRAAEAAMRKVLANKRVM